MGGFDILMKRKEGTVVGKEETPKGGSLCGTNHFSVSS